MTTRKTMTMERTFEASLDDVWALWTTKDGIESWWGPEGFAAEVHEIDVRVGGTMAYDMVAVAPEMVAFMKKAGMPVSQPCRFTYTDVVAKKRLAWRQDVDFVPGVTPYDVATSVELFEESGRVRMVMTLEAMHDAEWTKRAAAGWEQQLGKLARVIGGKR